MSNLEEKNILLVEQNQKLKQKIEDLEERLKKYTAPERGLNYYHKNKEKIAQYKKEYYQKQKAEKEKNKIG
jgi:cell division septum initiation protein DivIVA